MTGSRSDESTWSKIEQFSAKSSQLFLKKLSRNDTSWADDPGKHQAGFYVPREVRESGFFPSLAATNPAKPHIYFAPCMTLWPQTGEVKTSGMRHYSNKGPETHFTVIPHDLFSGLSPASWLIAGAFKEQVAGATHWLVVIDSISTDAETLETVLDIQSDFHFGLFDPGEIAAPDPLHDDAVASLIEEIHHAIRTGTLHRFVASVSELPPPAQIAAEARSRFFEATGTDNLDPYALAAPGDAVMRITRDIEYEIFKRHELRRRAVEVVAVLVRDPDTVASVVRGFPALDAIFLSASQQRKTRAGRSFEHHLARMMADGSVSFEEQAVLGGRRPDFVLPSARVLGLRDSRPFVDALILSAKTTLRERWKQITHERFNCAIFVATVDDRVSRAALDDMRSLGLTLVVPESLKKSRETMYPEHPAAISFRDFFDSEIKAKRVSLIKDQ